MTMSPAFSPLRGSSVAAAIFAGVVAMSVVNVLPVLVGVIVDHMSLDARQAGLIGSADVAGLAVGSAVCTLWRRASLRLLGSLGLAVLAAGDFATVLVHGFAPLAALRFAAGLGGGFALAVCYAVMGAGAKARDFAVFNIAQIGVGWLGMLEAPAILEHFGWRGVFTGLGAFAAAAAGGAVFLPVRVPHLAPSRPAAATDLSPRQRAAGAPGALEIATALSVLLFFTGQGAVWAYLDRMGALVRLPSDAVAAALAWCMFVGMIASGLASALELRRGLIAPLTAGYAITIAGVVWLWFAPALLPYFIAVCVFSFGWNLVTPYQFVAVAKVDAHGRLAMAASTASVAGLALGPAFAAPLADQGAYAAVRVIAIGLTLISAVALAPAVLAKRGARTA